MALETRRGRDGEIVRSWYARFSKAGRRVCMKLCDMKGELNASGNPDDEGDKLFERSRQNALREMERLQGEALEGTQTAHLTERLITIKTGRKWKERKIKELPAFTASMKGDRSPCWDACRNIAVSKFTEWAQEQKLKTVLDVTTEVAENYLAFLADGSKTLKTVQNIKGILVQVFNRALPEGFGNPFSRAILPTENIDRVMEHRTPLSIAEENLLLETARKTDPLIYKLVVTALSTGLRRGDICRLKWAGVKFRDNNLTVITSKTEAEVTLPIFPTFKEVLEGQLAEKEEGAEYIFPKAQRIIDGKNPDEITHRIKKVFAIMFAEAVKDAPEESQERPEAVPLADILPEVLEAVQRTKINNSKRLKMSKVLTLYAEGNKRKEIREACRICFDTISVLLHEAEDISGRSFMPESNSIRKAIRDVTRKGRAVGSRSASKYDWHCLRTTFVTRAIDGKISIDTLKALTGHATVELVLKHYYKPKGSDHASAFEKILPSGLMGSNPKAIESDVSRLADALKNLSKADKAELNKLLNRKELK